MDPYPHPTGFAGRLAGAGTLEESRQPRTVLRVNEIEQLLGGGCRACIRVWIGESPTPGRIDVERSTVHVEKAHGVGYALGDTTRPRVHRYPFVRCGAEQNWLFEAPANNVDMLPR
jgi:hypothetical protein